MKLVYYITSEIDDKNRVLLLDDNLMIVRTIAGEKVHDGNLSYFQYRHDRELQSITNEVHFFKYGE